MMALEQAVGRVLESWEAKAASETRQDLRRAILRHVTPLVAKLRASGNDELADEFDAALCKVWRR